MAVRLPDSLPFKAGQLFIVGAIVMALISALLLKNMVTSSVSKASKDKEAPKDAVTVVVAASYVAPGAQILRNQVKTVKWPKKYLPDDPDMYFTATSGVVGKFAKNSLFPGEPLFRAKLSGDDSNGGLPIVIPEGMRAVTIAVSEIKGVAGFVKPGDRVDVLTTFESETGEEKIQVTKTVLQDAMVLAAAQDMIDDRQPTGYKEPSGLKSTKDEEKSSKKLTDRDLEKQRKEQEKAREKAEKKAKRISSVTLALTPEEAETVTLAEETGSLRLILRPEGDHNVAELGGISDKELLNISGAFWTGSVAGKAAEKEGLAELDSSPIIPISNTGASGHTVEFIQGDEKQSLSF